MAYDSTIQRGNDFSLKFFKLKTGGTTISTPAVLTNGNITEGTTGLDVPSGTALSFALSDSITIQRFNIGITATGKPAISPLSPALTYTAAGTGSVLKVTSSAPAGVVGQGIVIKTPSMAKARVAGFFHYLNGVLPAAQIPNNLALDVDQLADLSGTLVEGEWKLLPAIIASPTKTTDTKLIENEIHNNSTARKVSASSINVKGEALSPDSSFEDLLTGVSSYIYDDGTIKVGQSGYKKGVCQQNRWFELVESGDSCGSSKYEIFLGTFAKASTDRAFEKGNIPFEVMQQPYGLFEGHESVFWSEAK